MIAASLSLITSFSAVAGIGGVNVQSNLGEPFSGSIVVTGQEAQAVLQNGASVSGNGISGTVAPHGDGNAIIRLRSNSVVNDPILTFTVRAGNQTRQYTAMINPSHYRPNPSQARSNRDTRKAVELKPQQQHHAVANDDVEIQQETREATPRTEKTYATSPRYHRVQAGESLASIAARYRPHGMSVQRAMRALMAANPRAFRNGRMYRNVTLYIPTASQFHAYAKSAQRKHQSPRISRGAAIVAPAVTENTTPDVAETPKETPSKVVTPPPVKVEPVKPVEPIKPKAKDQAAEEPSVAEKAVGEKAKPVAPAQPEASKPAVEETKPVQPEASQAEQMQPENTVAASESKTAPAETASVAAASVAEEKTEPVAEPQPTPPAEEPAADEGLDWTLIGGSLAGVAVLGGGAAYLLGRRKKSRADSFDDDNAAGDEEFDGSDIQFDGTASPETDDWMRDTGVAKADDSSDDFFDLPPVDTDVAPAASSQTFDLDDFEPEQFDDSSDEWALSVEEEPHAHANPLLVAENATSFDADDWQVDDIVSVESDVAEPARSLGSHNAVAADDFIIDDTPIGQPETAVSAANDFLSFDDSIQADDIIPAPAEETTFDLDAFNNALPDIVDTPAETAASDDFLDFDASDIVAPAAATAAVAAAASHVAAPEVSFDDFSLDTPAVEEVAPVLDAPEVPEFAADLDAPAIAEPAMDFTAPEVALDDFSVDAPAVEAPAVDHAMDFALDDFAVETPAEPAAHAALDDGLDFAVAEPAAVDFAAETPAFEPAGQSFADLSLEEPAVAAPAFDDLSFEQPAVSAPSFDDLSFDEPAAPAVEHAVDDLASWDIEELPETAHNDAGFVSEAVGLTEPLEAKLELAKMYLEIDDAVAARETLRELVTESHGEIQTQAQQLLDELGG
ncbi:MAG: FimV/HubP family polar landmark protein [Kingella oralis]